VAFLIGCNSSSLDDGMLAGQRAPAQAYGSGGSGDLAQAAAPFVAATTPGSSGYRIGPSDVLDVTVFKAPELSRTVQVGSNGLVNLPLIGDVQASGKTPAALERDLAGKYNAGYIKSPQITVFVKEYNSSRVTVDGAVKKPGVYPTKGHDTLMSAISLAEGLDRETASTEIVVFSVNEDGTRSAARYDLSTIRGGGARDPVIKAGDVIVVEDSATKAAFRIFSQILPVGSPISYLLVAL
jgi:polysaccharide export outer membrane protein